MRTILATVLLGLLVLLSTPRAECFEVGTHIDLTGKAVRASRMDEFLRSELNLLGGVAEAVSGRSAIGWLQEGSLREDDAVRFLNHFHNPLRNWDEAGLRVLGLPVPGSQSSILWGQSPALQPVDARFTWQDARQSFFEALTFQGVSAKTQVVRDDRLAVTFRTLGQLAHLVQDAAVPAHARNDPHPIYDGFDHFVEDTRSLRRVVFDELTSSSKGFDTAILAYPPNPLAPIPIARIIDTGDPEQADAVPSPGTTVGLAEYSNGNFLSSDTIFKGFPFPRIASLGNPVEAPDPVTGYRRSYFPKVADGEIGFRLVAKGAWTERLISTLAGNQGYVLDNGVYTDYARLLLPRAIGYSAGLLDYFFRGRLEIAAPDRFVYGRTNYREPVQTMDLDRNLNVFTQLTFKVRNATPGEDTACASGQQCTLVAVVQYRTGGPDVINAPPPWLSSQLFFAVSKPLAVVPTRAFQELTFDFGDSPLPANVADVFLAVVYRGGLGLETEAVAVGGKDLFEPTPVDHANSTDYLCYNGVLLHVADFGTYPPFVLADPITDPPQPRDPTGDGVMDLSGPRDVLNFSMKAWAGSGAAPASNDFALSQLSGGQYTRFFVLQDQPQFALSYSTGWYLERGTFPNTPGGDALFPLLPYWAKLNRIVRNPAGFIVHDYGLPGNFRGVMTNDVILDIDQNIDTFMPCVWDMWTKDPVARVEGTVAGP